MFDEPKIDDIYRHKTTGLTYRVLEVTFYKVSAVQDSPIPNWTWRGDRSDFLIDFVFICHYARSHQRK
jgi:hypothetical protein